MNGENLASRGISRVEVVIVFREASRDGLDPSSKPSRKHFGGSRVLAIFCHFIKMSLTSRMCERGACAAGDITRREIAAGSVGRK